MDPSIIVGLSIGLAVLVLIILVFSCKFAKKNEKDKHDIAKEKLLGSTYVHQQRNDSTSSEKNHKQKPAKGKSVGFYEKRMSDEENHYDRSKQSYEPRQRLFTEYIGSKNMKGYITCNEMKRQRTCSEYIDGVCKEDEELNNRMCNNMKKYINLERKHVKNKSQIVDRRQTSLKNGIKSKVSEKMNGKLAEKHRRKYKDKAETKEGGYLVTRPSVKQMLEEVKWSSTLSKNNGTCITINARTPDNTCSDGRHKSSEESNRGLSPTREIVQPVNAQVRAEKPAHQAIYTENESHTLRQEMDYSSPEYEVHVLRSREIIFGDERPEVSAKPTVRKCADTSRFVQTSSDMESNLPPIRNESFTEALSTWRSHSESAKKAPRPKSSIIYAKNRLKPSSSLSNQRKIDVSSNNDSLTYPHEQLQSLTSPQEQFGASGYRNKNYLLPSANIKLVTKDSLKANLNVIGSTSSSSKQVSPTTNTESRLSDQSSVSKQSPPNTNVLSPKQPVHHKQESPTTNKQLVSLQQPYPNGLLPVTKFPDPSESQKVPAGDQPSPNTYQQSVVSMNKQQVMVTTSRMTLSPRNQILSMRNKSKLSPELYKQEHNNNFEQPSSSINAENSRVQVSIISMPVDHRKKRPSVSIPVSSRTEQLLASVPADYRKEHPSISIPVDGRTKQLSASVPADYRQEHPSIAIPADGRTEQLSASVPADYRTEPPSISIPADGRTEQLSASVTVDYRKEHPSTFIPNEHPSMSLPPNSTISIQSTRYGNTPTLQTAYKKTQPIFESRPVTSPLNTSSAEKPNKEFLDVELSDVVISERNDFEVKESSDFLTSESNFNPGQTSTPKQSQTDISKIMTESHLNPGQTDIPKIMTESHLNPGQTDIPKIMTESHLNPCQTDIPKIMTESHLNPGQKSTNGERKPKVHQITSETHCNTDQNFANCKYQRSNRTVLHSILKKRRADVSLSGQDLPRSYSDDTVSPVRKCQTLDRTLLPPRAKQQSVKLIDEQGEGQRVNFPNT
ncbi:uncharacterized protein LOC123559594 [Mercenaria mercenaria]|uniref:uncharacterized protein LOC123559594 n=1 Tax=Mercenaria mercenaria TaxID=6596 RepID=UPI00234F6687|nr:uncharacterized protein LOC123559594 [Mercenaria mercenaria]